LIFSKYLFFSEQVYEYGDEDEEEEER